VITLKSRRHAVGFDQDLVEKLMRLALCPAAPQGEWHAAALAYFRVLRAAEVTAEELRELFALGQEPAAPQELPPDSTPIVGFGRYRGQTVRWIVEHDPAYAEWLSCKATTLSPALRSELMRDGATGRRRHDSACRYPRTVAASLGSPTAFRLGVRARYFGKRRFRPGLASARSRDRA
jgi:hypothetical protein